jgi:hypothetical protein
MASSLVTQLRSQNSVARTRPVRLVIKPLLAISVNVRSKAPSVLRTVEAGQDGIFLTLEEPTAGMRKAAAAVGIYETEYGKFQNILMSIDDLFAGKKPHMPWGGPVGFQEGQDRAARVAGRARLQCARWQEKICRAAGSGAQQGAGAATDAQAHEGQEGQREGEGAPGVRRLLDPAPLAGAKSAVAAVKPSVLHLSVVAGIA